MKNQRYIIRFGHTKALLLKKKDQILAKIPVLGNLTHMFINITSELKSIYFLKFKFCLLLEICFLTIGLHPNYSPRLLFLSVTNVSLFYHAFNAMIINLKMLHISFPFKCRYSNLTQFELIAPYWQQGNMAIWLLINI